MSCNRIVHANCTQNTFSNSLLASARCHRLLAISSYHEEVALAPCGEAARRESPESYRKLYGEGSEQLRTKR